MTTESMANVEKIAAGLTEAQRAAMLHPNAGGTAYAWTRITTCAALSKRGLVSQVQGRGAFWSPTTGIRWPLTPLGQQVREILRRRS